MNMENNVVEDAVRLAKCILSTLASSNKVIIVTLVKLEGKETIISPVKYYMTAFCYAYDQTPHFLENCGLIEAKQEDEWFMRIEPMKKRYKDMFGRITQNDITPSAWRKGCLPKD